MATLKEELKKRIAQGESSTLQFKLDWSDNDKITKDLLAFANSRGGLLVFGVEDKSGRVEGLTYDRVQAISSMAGNMAENNIVPPLYISSYTEEIEGKTILVVEVPFGNNKPYKTKKGGQIYVKQGADKRQVSDNREILRMFYESGQYHPDIMGVPDTSVRNLSESLIDKFFLKQFGKSKEDFDVPVDKLYENLCLLDEKGQATLAGMLFFGIMPTWKCPQFKIKAVCFVGNDRSGTEYRDSVDIEGTIPEMYEQAIRFCEGNLRHLQDGQSFNSVGKLEVSRIALEELVQNALVHRETIGVDVVKLLIFDNRIEIESPGCLPADLTVEKIMLGNSKIRNPQLSQFCGKTMPYRGLGTGITRAMKSGSRVELYNDIESDKFVATIWRDKNNAQINENNAQKSGDNAQEGTYYLQKLGFNVKISADKVRMMQESTHRLLATYDKLSSGKIKTLEDIILLIASRPAITSRELVEITKLSRRTITEYTNILQKIELLSREGSKKTGSWKICDDLMKE